MMSVAPPGRIADQEADRPRRIVGGAGAARQQQGWNRRWRPDPMRRGVKSSKYLPGSCLFLMLKAGARCNKQNAARKSDAGATQLRRKDDAMPVKVNALDHLVINVNDVARSAEWYAQNPRHGDQGVRSRRGQDQADLAGIRQPEDQCAAEETPTRSSGSPPIMKPPAATISASSPSSTPDEVVAHLKANGVAIEEGPSKKQGARGTHPVGLLPGSRRQPDRDFVVRECSRQSLRRVSASDASNPRLGR